MSLYNMLMGTNEFAGILLAILFKTDPNASPDVPPRLRDCYLYEVEGEPRICVFTRLGGGNRETYADAITTLRAHPLFIRDYDDAYDTTYATFEFRLPPIDAPPAALTMLLETMTMKETPMERYRDMVSRMGRPASRNDEDVERAMEVGKALEVLVPALVKDKS